MATMVATITVKEVICWLFQDIFLGFVHKNTAGFFCVGSSRSFEQKFHSSFF